MRLLITGYPGWLTSRFLETLESYPPLFDSIRCLVLPGQIDQIRPEVPLESVPGDILNPPTLELAMREVDVVLHAAGVLHVKRNADFCRINRDGTKHVLQACVKNRVKKLIYISTNAAQGFCEGRGKELVESDPCRPESHYGKSKYEGEQVVERFRDSGKIETVILRSAMFYGPPVPPRHVDVFKRVQSGRFPVFGPGTNLRSLTYIDHLVQGIHLAIQKPIANGQVYYIADREIPTLVEIIQAMADALGCEVKIEHWPLWVARACEQLDLLAAKADIYWMLPHIIGESDKNIACRIEKAEKELGYQPRIHYREGYQRAIAWCRERKLI